MGFCFAGVFLLLARPTWKTMLASLVLVLPGLWLRAYAAGYVKKNAELTTTGPYAHTRNPLYLGSMLIAFGFAAAAWSLAIFVALALLFAVIYVPTIQGEEAYLRAHFAGFHAYARAVPRLLPRLLRRRSGAGHDRAQGGNAEKFSAALYRRHREYNSAMGAAAIYLALAARLLFHPR
jgi:protein-S-isoprenylcysteine O-methyltransferase Ste14